MCYENLYLQGMAMNPNPQAPYLGGEQLSEWEADRDLDIFQREACRVVNGLIALGSGRARMGDRDEVMEWVYAL